MAFPMADFDRFLFAFTIGSHILLVTTSIGLSIVISITEFLAARRGDRYYAALARRLLRPFVISFGVGTASGIVMAVELVNLFPTFMTLVSRTGVISIFYVEVFAFFLETVFLVLYVYFAGTFRGRYARWGLTVPILIGSLLSAVLIVMVNAWMNTPNGFNAAAYIANGSVTGVDPWAPFLTASTGTEIFHVLAVVPLTGMLLLGGYFAYRYVNSRVPEERELLLRGLRIATAVGAFLIVMTAISGALEIDNMWRYQPLKYAALELNANPGTDLPETLFGTLSNGSLVGGIQIPGLQGILSNHAMMPGLSQFPSSEWPPLYVHTTFDIMALLGGLLGLFVFAYVLTWLLGRRPFERRLAAYGLGLFAIVMTVVMELGWMTDEVGRQPWIVYNVLRVDAAANTSPDLLVPGLIIVAFYLILVPVTFYLMIRVFNGRPLELDLQGPKAGKDVNY